MMPVHLLNIQGDERVYFEMKNILSQTVLSLFQTLTKTYSKSEKDLIKTDSLLLKKFWLISGAT